MAKSLLNPVAEMVQDNLITDTQPRPHIWSVTLDGTTPATLKRGTLLTIDLESEGKAKPAESASLEEATIAGILADDVTITESDSAGVIAAVYDKGCFDPELILDKDGAKLELDVKTVYALQSRDIYLKSQLHVYNAKEAD